MLMYFCTSGSLPTDLLDRANTLIGIWRGIGRPTAFGNFALGRNYESINENKSSAES
jgi:hypothetical protein